jgi:hypothetical protein
MHRTSTRRTTGTISTGTAWPAGSTRTSGTTHQRLTRTHRACIDRTAGNRRSRSGGRHSWTRRTWRRRRRGGLRQTRDNICPGRNYGARGRLTREIRPSRRTQRHAASRGLLAVLRRLRLRIRLRMSRRCGRNARPLRADRGTQWRWRRRKRRSGTRGYSTWGARNRRPRRCAGRRKWGRAVGRSRREQRCARHRLPRTRKDLPRSRCRRHGPSRDRRHRAGRTRRHWRRMAARERRAQRLNSRNRWSGRWLRSLFFGRFWFGRFSCGRLRRGYLYRRFRSRNRRGTL